MRSSGLPPDIMACQKPCIRTDRLVQATLIETNGNCVSWKLALRCCLHCSAVGSTLVLHPTPYCNFRSFPKSTKTQTINHHFTTRGNSVWAGAPQAAVSPSKIVLLSSLWTKKKLFWSSVPGQHSLARIVETDFTPKELSFKDWCWILVRCANVCFLSLLCRERGSLAGWQLKRSWCLLSSQMTDV